MLLVRLAFYIFTHILNFFKSLFLDIEPLKINSMKGREFYDSCKNTPTLRSFDGEQTPRFVSKRMSSKLPVIKGRLNIFGNNKKELNRKRLTLNNSQIEEDDESAVLLESDSTASQLVSEGK